MFRIIKSLIVIIAFASVVSGASWGYYHDSETSLGNVFTMGTVEVDAVQGSGAMIVSDLSEGECEYGQLTAENRGSLPAYFWMNISRHSGDAGMWNNLLLFVVDDDSGTSIYGGLIKNFEKVRTSDAINSSTDPVAPGGTQNISYAVCLPCSSSESLQGKTLGWNFEMTASSGANDFVSAPFSHDDTPDCPADPGGGTI